jgi:beta-glucosidase
LAGHIPAYYNYKTTARRGYLVDDVSAAWSFGYGLSNTSFSVSPPTLDVQAIEEGATGRVSVNVTNTGDRAGSEVVQLYIRDKFSYPFSKAFEKVFLEPGESQTVSFELGQEQLELLDINMEWTVEPGDFDIMVGTSSRAEDLKSVMLTVR